MTLKLIYKFSTFAKNRKEMLRKEGHVKQDKDKSGFNQWRA